MQRAARMKKELKILTETPYHGISCWLKDDTLNTLEARKLLSLLRLKVIFRHQDISIHIIQFHF